MDFKLNKVSALKLAKNTKSAYIIFLRAYKAALAVKIVGIDTIIKILSPKPIPIEEKKAMLLITDNIKKENNKMKKTNFFAIFTCLAAIAAAVGAAAYYLRKKEKELEEYESMLFSEEYLEDYMPDNESCDCDDDCCCESSTQNENCSSKLDEKMPEEPQF